MHARARYLSTIQRAPISYFVYSSLSFFGRLRGWELPGMWFVSACEDAGRDRAAVRQTLYRMESEGELVTRRVGRAKYYRPSSYALATIGAGSEKIFAPAQPEWDGKWTVVALDLRQPSQRVQRERVVQILSAEGFGSAGGDVYYHPRDVGQRLDRALSPQARPHVVIMRAPLLNAEAGPQLSSLWNVRALSARYRKTLAHLLEIEALVERGVDDRQAFVMRFSVVFDFLTIAWDDPHLPFEVLPEDWSGEITRKLAARLYDRLKVPAIRHADLLLEQTAPPRALTRTAR